MPKYKIMNDMVNFFFPIDPKWSEQQFLKHFYDKVKNYESIYGYEEHLTYLKKSKTAHNFIQRASQDISKYPLVYFLLMLADGAYRDAKERNLKNDEMLVFRFFNFEPWPPKTMKAQFWRTFVMDKDRFDFYYNI